MNKSKIYLKSESVKLGGLMHDFDQKPDFAYNGRVELKLKNMKNKKIFLAILPIVILTVVFSPYTIVKLTSYGQDLFSNNPQYQAAEVQLAQIKTQEQADLAQLVALDTKNASDNISIVPAVSEAKAFDPAVAPGTVRAKILIADTKKAPDFSVRIKFIAVGEKSFETKPDEKGNMEISLTSGRYYAEVIPEDNTYRLKGDDPAFFLSANSEKDLGELYLIKK